MIAAWRHYLSSICDFMLRPLTATVIMYLLSPVLPGARPTDYRWGTPWPYVRGPSTRQSPVKLYPFMIRALYTVSLFNPGTFHSLRNVRDRQRQIHQITISQWRGIIREPLNFKRKRDSVGIVYRSRAATLCAESNIEDHIIKILGWWSSNCYIKSSRNTITSVHNAMS